LPNLETKFVAANTLIGLDSDSTFKPTTVYALEKQLEDVRHRHFSARTPETKRKYRDRDALLRNQIAVDLINADFPATSADQIANWNPYEQNSNASFFDKYWMFGIEDGFDIIIGNPPYIQLQSNSGALANLYKDQGYETFERTGDIYCLFYEKGYRLLKPNGHLIYITSNKWMRAGYGESMRKFLANKTNPITLIDFAGQKIFDAATVDVNILLFCKSNNLGKTEACIIKEKCIDNLSVFVRQSSAKSNFKKAGSWVILSSIEQRIKTKIEAAGKPLKDWNINIYRGILTGFNEAFIIDKNTKEGLIAEDPNSADIIRPILRGRDIVRYGFEFNNLWLINTHNGIRENGVKRIFIDDYPAIKKHLDQYYDELKNRADKGDTPYNLRNCAYLDDFSKQKILWAETMRIHKGDTKNFPRFGFEGNGEYVTDKTCFFATGNQLKFIVAVLNSTVGRYLCSQYVSILDDGGYLMQKIFLEKIPIAPYSSELEKLIEMNRCEEIESEINDIVYHLYNLSKEEISFIESLQNLPLQR